MMTQRWLRRRMRHRRKRDGSEHLRVRFTFNSLFFLFLFYLDYLGI
jgi:hypothetical protein